MDAEQAIHDFLANADPADLVVFGRPRVWIPHDGHVHVRDLAADDIGPAIHANALVIGRRLRRLAGV